MAGLFSRSKTLCGQPFNNQGLADAAKVSKSYMSQILSGQRSPSEEILKRMAGALQVDVPRLARELRKRHGA